MVQRDAEVRFALVFILRIERSPFMLRAFDRLQGKEPSRFVAIQTVALHNVEIDFNSQAWA